MNRIIILSTLVLLLSLPAAAGRIVTGVVRSGDGEPINGAKVSQTNNPRVSAITNQQGMFSIVLDASSYITVNYNDALIKRVMVQAAQDDIEIVLSGESNVVNAGNFATNEQRKTQAISYVGTDILDNNSSFRPDNALFGLIPGLAAIQKTGWDSGANMIVRGQGSLISAQPLIVVDGFPRPMEYLNIKEIESISVLKDGAATALWGAQGANGVIVVTTKRGSYNKHEISVDYKFGVGMPINQPKFVDSYTYAQAVNEALYYDGLSPRYNLDAFRDASDPDLFPNTDWMKEGLANSTSNHQLDVTARGGGNKVRYFSTIGYKTDYGILNKDYAEMSDRFTAPMRKYGLNLRTNLDVDITKSTLFKFNMMGFLYETKRPNRTEGNIFGNLMKVPSAAFPVNTSDGKWGSDGIYKMNPIADIGESGYYKENTRFLSADFRIIQDFSNLVKGLRVEGAVAYDNNAVYMETWNNTYEYQINTPVHDSSGNITGKNTQSYGKSDFTVDNTGLSRQYMNSHMEFLTGYSNSVCEHNFDAFVMYRQETTKPTGRYATRKRQYVNAYVGYDYMNKYMLDVVVSHYGTSVLPKNDKFRTYPSVSAAWMISEESFMRSSGVVDMLKLRASWGKSGYDGIGYNLDQQFWVNSGNYFFYEGNRQSAGIKEGMLPVTVMRLETADKFNIGVDANFFGKLSFQADIYKDRRRNIPVSSSNLVSGIIGVELPAVNAGGVDTKGFETSLMWQDKKGDFSYYVGGNFCFVRSEIKENGEGYKPYPYLSAKGNSIGQIYGLEAIGYFNDDQDIASSPSPKFSDVRPGDIKYRDQNKDDVIDEYDIIAIGHSSTIPEIYYGISLGFKYKGLGIDLYFQGLGNYSKMLNTANVYWPLRNNTNISTWYMNDKVRWTEDTKDIANVPRLTTLNNANNFRSSTQWLANGAYFKLRNLNIYYDLPSRWVKKLRMDNIQVYVRGNNLFSIDHIKHMNCEDLTINYPDMTSLYFGVNIKF